MKNLIFLIGMMGCGKTTTATLVSQKIGCEFVDTDMYVIDRFHLTSIVDIFSSKGEEEFRRQEINVLKEIINGKISGGNTKLASGSQIEIVATGGGIVTENINRRRMKEHGQIIFLNARVDTLVKRVENDETRPLATDIHAIYYDREETYRSLADFEILVDDKTPEQVADDVIYILNSLYNVVKTPIIRI